MRIRLTLATLFIAAFVIYAAIFVNVSRDITGPLASVLRCHTSEEAGWYLNEVHVRLSNRGWREEIGTINKLITFLGPLDAEPGLKQFRLVAVKKEVSMLVSDWEGENIPPEMSTVGLIEKYRGGLWITLFMTITFLIFLSTFIPAQREESVRQGVFRSSV